jgi:putative ABC transport system permease protein
MHFTDVMRVAYKSLRTNLSRSALTILGLSIGVGACIAIGSLGTAAVKEVQKEMGRFGVDRIWIEESAGNQRRMSAEDVSALGGVGTHIAPMCYGALRAVNGTRSALCAVVATTADYAGVENLVLEDGRFLMAQDEENLLRTIVIEDGLKEDLFGNLDCLGEKITLGDTRYTVVGVIKTQVSEYFAGDTRPKAYVPVSTYQQITGSTALDEIIVRAEGKSVSLAASEAKAALKNVHAQGDSFVVSSMAEQIASADRIILIITTVLIVIGVICMVTGGVGVMNVLLTCVRERRREIGIRKALGAKDGEIFAQFVCEAAFYGTAGALFGLALGIFLTKAGEMIVHINATPVPWVIACAVAFSCLVGAVCGIYPAMRAAAVSPVTAMRQT